MIAALARLLSRRSRRERALLALLGLGAVPAALVGLVALPLIDAGAAARAELDAARATQAWYRARQVEIAALPRSGEVAAAVESPAPVGLGGIESRLIAAGLRPSVSLLANAANGRVALSLEAVPFVDLMGWIDGLQGMGYGLAALQLVGVAPGDVDAELQLEPLR